MKKIDSFRFNWLIRYFLLLTGLSITLGTPVAYILEESNRPNLFILFIIILFGLFIFSVSRSRFDIFEDHFDFVNFGFHKRVFFKEIENCTICKNFVTLHSLNKDTNPQINNSYENFEKIKKFLKDRFPISNKQSVEDKKDMADKIKKFIQTHLPNGLLTVKTGRSVIIKETIISILFILTFIAASLFSIELHPPKAPKYGILIITLPAGVYFLYRILYFLSLKITFTSTDVLIKSILREKRCNYSELIELGCAFNLQQVFSSYDQKIITEFTQIFSLKAPIHKPQTNHIEKFNEKTMCLKYSSKFKQCGILGITAVILLLAILSIVGAVIKNYEMCAIASSIAVVTWLFFHFNSNLSLTQTLYHDRIEINKKGKITTYYYTEFRYLKKTVLHGKFFLVYKDLTKPDIVLLPMTDDAFNLLKQVVPFTNSEQTETAEIEESKKLCVNNSSFFTSTEQLTKVSQKWTNISLLYFFIGGMIFPFICLTVLQKFGINGSTSIKTLYACTILFDSILLLKTWKYREINDYPKLMNFSGLISGIIVFRLITLFFVSESHISFNYLHLTVITILFTLLFLLIFRKMFKYIHKKRNRIIYAYITTTLFLLSTIISINFFLDFSTPTKLNATVISRETAKSAKGHERYYLIFHELGTKNEYRLKASGREYRYAEIGEEAVLYQKSGALGIPWIYDFKILSFD